MEGSGHKLYIDNLFSSPDLFDDMTKQIFMEQLSLRRKEYLRILGKRD